MNAANNHGTCWVMQVAAFAKFTGNQKLLEFCRERYKNVLLPNQMAADGSFPQELRRTKPYGYSIFNLDAMATICQCFRPKRTTSGTMKQQMENRLKRELNFYIHLLPIKANGHINKM